MKLIQHASWVILLPSFICYFSSNKQSGHTFRTYRENGVLICETTGGPRYSVDPFQYEPLITLRGNPSREESLLYYFMDWTVDSAGNYYVIDQGNHRVVIYNSSGDFIRSFGREGSGPGEVRSMELLSLRDGILSVFDARLQRTSIFHIDGSLIETVRLTKGGRINGLERTSDGNLLARSIHWPIIEHPWYETLSITHLTADGKDTLATVKSHTDEASARLPAISGRFNPPRHALRIPFEGQPSAVYVPERGILLTDGATPVLRWYDLTGRLIQEIRLGLPEQKVTSEMRRKINSGSKNRQGDPIEWIFPENISVSTNIFIDDSGFIWLEAVTKAFAGASDSVMHVVAPNGEYLGMTELPAQARRFTQGLFLGAKYEYENTQYVPVSYRITPAVKGLKYP